MAATADMPGNRRSPEQSTQDGWVKWETYHSLHTGADGEKMNTSNPREEKAAAPSRGSRVRNGGSGRTHLRSKLTRRNSRDDLYVNDSAAEERRRHERQERSRLSQSEWCPESTRNLLDLDGSSYSSDGEKMNGASNPREVKAAASSRGSRGIRNGGSGRTHLRSKLTRRNSRDDLYVDDSAAEERRRQKRQERNRLSRSEWCPDSSRNLIVDLDGDGSSYSSASSNMNRRNGKLSSTRKSMKSLRSSTGGLGQGTDHRFDFSRCVSDGSRRFADGRGKRRDDDGCVVSPKRKGRQDEQNRIHFDLSALEERGSAEKSKTKREDRPRRRATKDSVDDIEIEMYKRELKRRSKRGTADDIDVENMERHSRRNQNEDNPRRRSNESSGRKGYKSPSSRKLGPRRNSDGTVDRKKLDDVGLRRSSAGDIYNISQGRCRRPSVESLDDLEIEAFRLQRKREQNSKSRRRRPSVDDLAIEEMKKESKTDQKNRDRRSHVKKSRSERNSSKLRSSNRPNTDTSYFDERESSRRSKSGGIESNNTRLISPEGESRKKEKQRHTERSWDLELPHSRSSSQDERVGSPSGDDLDKQDSSHSIASATIGETVAAETVDDTVAVVIHGAPRSNANDMPIPRNLDADNLEAAGDEQDDKRQSRFSKRSSSSTSRRRGKSRGPLRISDKSIESLEKFGDNLKQQMNRKRSSKRKPMSEDGATDRDDPNTRKRSSSSKSRRSRRSIDKSSSRSSGKSQQRKSIMSRTRKNTSRSSKGDLTGQSLPSGEPTSERGDTTRNSKRPSLQETSISQTTQGSKAGDKPMRKSFGQFVVERKWCCLCCVCFWLILVVCAVGGWVILGALQQEGIVLFPPEEKNEVDDKAVLFSSAAEPSLMPSQYPSSVPSATLSQVINDVDPNEYCLPCDADNCGRCAWCEADRGFQSDVVYAYRCHSSPRSIPEKVNISRLRLCNVDIRLTLFQCFFGDKRVQLINQHIKQIADCKEGFAARPKHSEIGANVNVCVDEVYCVKKFYLQPDCDAELPGSTMAIETCQ